MATFERTVTLHIYDFVGVGSRTSSFLSSMKMGLHHSGVEVGGHEYSFNDAGIFRSPVNACARGDSPQCVLVESKHVGVQVGSINEFNGIVNAMRRDFPPGTYALTSQNCNHFADAFCKALTGNGIPAYVNRMAGYGKWLGVGAKGFQVNDGSSKAAPTEQAAEAKPDPNRNKKKELTPQQQAMLAKIKAGK